jgi:hypothetical protein
MEKLEKTLTDVLNAGIAIFRSGEASLHKVTTELTKSFEELKAKGEADQSEAAEKLRRLVGDLVSQMNDIESRAKTVSGETLKNLEITYKSILEQIQKVASPDQIASLQKNIDDLLTTIRNKMEEVRSKKN